MSERHRFLWTPFFLRCTILKSSTVKVQELFCNIMSSIWHWYKMVKSAFQILEDAILLWRYIILAKFWEIFGKVLAERIISINPLFSVKSFLWKALLTIITCNQQNWWLEWSWSWYLAYLSKWMEKDISFFYYNNIYQLATMMINYDL